MLLDGHMYKQPVLLNLTIADSSLYSRTMSYKCWRSFWKIFFSTSYSLVS